MQKLTAMILASRDVGEFDRLYFLYSKELGLVRVLGRGVRKVAARLAGHLEPVTLSEVYMARSRGRGQITSAITLENFENIKRDLKKLEEVLAVFRFLVKNFSEEEKDEKIFDLLQNFLKILEKEKDILPVVEAFWWKFFDLLGKRPETMKCVRCGSKLSEKIQNYFSVAEGGIVCEKCLEKRDEFGKIAPNQITPNQIKFLRLFLSQPFEKILKVKPEEKDFEKLARLRKEFQKYNF